MRPFTASQDRRPVLNAELNEKQLMKFVPLERLALTPEVKKTIWT
jgi:hypothetical protein